MIAMAARTGTKINLAALAAAGWWLMVSAAGVLRCEGFPYALDNGAWTAFQMWLKGRRRSKILDLAKFCRAVDKLGAGAEFIAVPDIVEGGEQSWLLTRYWLRRLRRDRRLRGVRLLIVVQDGMSPDYVKRWLSPRVGIFIGGSTEWKLATAKAWADAAHEMGAWCHAGRVNSQLRIELMDVAGVDSFDGSSASKFVKTLPLLDRARRSAVIRRSQLDLYTDAAMLKAAGIFG